MATHDIVRSYPLIDELLEARRNLFAEEAVSPRRSGKKLAACRIEIGRAGSE